MAVCKKQNQYIETEENLVLPQFGCKCGLEYSTLSSLSNHIKMTHQNNVEEWKIKRGVPEGRRQRLNPSIKEKIKNSIKQNQFIRKDNLSEKFSASQCRGLFMDNIKYIKNLLEKYNLNKQQEIILQKEHIKFQELWNDIDISQISNQTQQYLNAYCCIFFDIPFDQTKQEDQEEQKEEKNHNESFYFYKNLFENNRSTENKDIKQKIERNLYCNSESPKNKSTSTNHTNTDSSSKQFIRHFNTSSISSPAASDSFFVNVHPSLNFKDDQYMLNFFKNYLQSDKPTNSA